ncbi:ATP-binding cassette domain-containing protein [Corynebacterium meridianum]|uniref:ATP-binding cassette domain-containing protein n=1 Tax=Corynebacterium meridianum TaxID=2765363 RepID=A0A934M563_9CORY|nr:ATP-binding cassette domain-containing protein [Corynebacterium meridianum]MBI8989781.1 ATP-binding cassette domain-containing protein [Corynebacterium meridianum]
MSNHEPAIECRHLSISYRGQRVLDEFSMTVERGRIHALVGRNGAGKSTCFRIILGLEDRAGGTVEVDRASVGASVNGPALYPHLGARDNLRVHTLLLGLDDAEIDRVLGVVGLTGTGRKKVRSFSTGMRSRLALAVALLGGPQILLLDEPQNGLDPEGTVALRGLLRGYADAGGTVLISSHQLGEIARTADDITVLHDGRAAYSGPLDAFAPAGELESRFLDLTAIR